MQKMQETEVQPLGQEDALEEGMATHSIILAWEIPWTEEPGGLQFTGSQVDMTEYAHTHTCPVPYHPKMVESVDEELPVKVLGVQGANYKVIREFPTTQDVSAPDGGSAMFSY